MTKELKVPIPEESLSALGIAPERLSRELLEAAVLRWFEEGRLSQGQAATMLGLKRGEFFDVLYEHRVSPIQMTADELKEEFRRG